jgi:phosphonate transport system substrate-binding protein
MLRTLLSRTVTAVALTLSGLAANAQAPAPTELNFGIISTEASVNQKKVWEPFLQAMAKSTGFKINGFYATDYAGVIEAMRFSKVQVAWYGNKSGIEAVDRASGEVFAQVVATDGSLGYYSHIIVHKDSPYNKLEDILKCDKTLDFGIGDPNSTSGFLVPTAYIFAAKGVDPKSCFKTVRNANHQANAMAVANKQVAAATNNSEDLQRLMMTSPQAREQIKIIWTSPIIPLDPIVWRKDLDPAIKAKLYTFLLSYGRVGTPDEIKVAKEMIAGMIWSPLRPSSDNQLLPMRKLEASRDLLRVQSDAKLSDEDKKKQSADIQAQLAKLDELEKKAATDPFQKRLEAFVEADKAGNQPELKRMIAEFAAGNARTN